MSIPFTKAGRLSLTQFRQCSVEGYELRFVSEEDRRAFAPFRFYLIGPKSRAVRKWCVVECETGAVLNSSKTMKGCLKFLGQVYEIWPVYRLRYAFVLHDRVQNHCHSLSEHVSNTYRSEEFDALLVLAKLEGVTLETKYKQLKPLFEQKELPCN